jgi:hypothetical protein
MAVHSSFTSTVSSTDSDVEVVLAATAGAAIDPATSAASTTAISLLTRIAFG